MPDKNDRDSDKSGHNNEHAAEWDALWKFNRELLHRNHQDIAARGVSVAAQSPADVLATLRMAAEPDIQAWVQSMGADGTAILTDFRRAIGRE